MAEWLGRRLQISHRRFDSDHRHQVKTRGYGSFCNPFCFHKIPWSTLWSTFSSASRLSIQTSNLFMTSRKSSAKQISYLSSIPVMLCPKIINKNLSACMDKTGGVTVDMKDCLGNAYQQMNKRLNFVYGQLI